MRLDDERIERYSRQLILQEVGPRGQERLLASRVAVVGTDVAAARVVGYLAAAGVGAIAADPALHGVVDPDHRDCTLTPLAAAPEAVDVLVVSAGSPAASADMLAAWRDRSPARIWIAGGYAGGVPPCPRCALASRDPRDVELPLATLRDATLGTVVATEVVKVLLAIGTPFTGRLLAHDPATAAIESIAVSARPDCGC